MSKNKVNEENKVNIKNVKRNRNIIDSFIKNVRSVEETEEWKANHEKAQKIIENLRKGDQIPSAILQQVVNI